MSEGVITALIVGILTPVVLLVAQGWQRRRDLKQEWERQDEVAARVREVATHAAIVAEKVETVATEARAVAAKVEIVAERQISTAAEAAGQMHEIKTMVDGTLTESKRAELASTRRELILLHASAVTEHVRDAIALAEQRIHELEQEIGRRVELDAVAKTQGATTREQAIDLLKETVATEAHPTEPEIP